MVAKRLYIPSRGDVVWLDFNPVLGHEQRGRRPALVISSVKYNAKSGMALVCPITLQIKGYPFEIEFETKKTRGVILADQICAVDWKERNAKKIGAVSELVIEKAQEYVKKLVLE